MCCGTEAGSYLRLIDSCITQLKAQGPSRTCNESKEEVTLSGARAMPATMAWPYRRPSVPSSKVLTMTPFLPAIRPWRQMTTLPDLRLRGGARGQLHGVECSRVLLTPLHAALTIFEQWCSACTTLPLPTGPTHDSPPQSPERGHEMAR